MDDELERCYEISKRLVGRFHRWSDVSDYVIPNYYLREIVSHTFLGTASAASLVVIYGVLTGKADADELSGLVPALMLFEGLDVFKNKIALEYHYKLQKKLRLR